MICDEHVKITWLMLASRLHYAYNDPLNDKNLDLSLMSQSEARLPTPITGNGHHWRLGEEEGTLDGVTQGLILTL